MRTGGSAHPYDRATPESYFTECLAIAPPRRGRGTFTGCHAPEARPGENRLRS
jgi:hypothetical protein